MLAVAMQARVPTLLWGAPGAGKTTAVAPALLAEPWQAWAGRVVDELSAVHPDLRSRLQRIDLGKIDDEKRPDA